MGIFNDDWCIHNINGTCSLNLSQLAWENELLKKENEELKKKLKLKKGDQINMGWFIFGAFVGMFTTAWATLRMLEAIYPEVADEIASGEGMRKVQKWKEQNRK